MIHEGKDDEAELSANALKAFNTSITHFLKQKTGYFDEINKQEQKEDWIHHVIVKNL